MFLDRSLVSFYLLCYTNLTFLILQLREFDVGGVFDVFGSPDDDDLVPCFEKCCWFELILNKVGRIRTDCPKIARGWYFLNVGNCLVWNILIFYGAWSKLTRSRALKSVLSSLGSNALCMICNVDISKESWGV